MSKAAFGIAASEAQAVRIANGLRGAEFSPDQMGRAEKEGSLLSVVTAPSAQIHKPHAGGLLVPSKEV